MYVYCRREGAVWSCVARFLCEVHQSWHVFLLMLWPFQSRHSACHGLYILTMQILHVISHPWWDFFHISDWLRSVWKYISCFFGLQHLNDHKLTGRPNMFISAAQFNFKSIAVWFTRYQEGLYCAELSVTVNKLTSENESESLIQIYSRLVFCLAISAFLVLCLLSHISTKHVR